MVKIKLYALTIFVMSIISTILLLCISLLTYCFKWQADTAMLAITFTYILTGFFGGMVMKWIPSWHRRKLDKAISVQQEPVSIGSKMLESIIVASVFMLLLLILSITIVRDPFALSSRFLMIWMLLVGSACLGRIL